MGHLTAAANAPNRVISPQVAVRPTASNGAAYTVAPVTATVIRCVITGFWTMSVLANFVRDADAAIRALDCSPGEHRVLCDVTHAAIQPQPVFAAFLAMLVTAEHRPCRVALLSTNALSRMQARRLIAARPDIGLFDDEREAFRWLVAAA